MDDISGNLITTGQTLQTQITSNDSDVSTLTSNLISTGQSITSEIAVVSGLTTSNDTDIATLTTNLVTTGQTLQTQITSNDSDISTLTSNLITTGQTLQVTGHLADTTVLESFSQGLNVGTSSDLASRKLHVVGDIEVSGTIYQSGSVFEGGGGGGSSTFLALTDTPGSFTASKYLSVNSAGNAVEMVNTIQSGFATIDQGLFTGFDLTGSAVGIVQNASGSLTSLDLGDNKWDVSIIEETDSGGEAGDANWTDVSLLLPLDGANAATSTTDESDNNHSITFAGDAQISTAQSKWGGSSLLFDGSDYVYAANSTDFQFGTTGDFTVEFWLYPLSLGADNGLFSTHQSGSTGFSINIRGSTGRIDCYGGGQGTFIGTSDVAAGKISQDVWTHLALVRSSGIIKLYKNGTLMSGGTYDQAAGAVDTDGTSGAYLGQFYANNYNGQFCLNGYMDDVRVTKGVARYTSNFTPPAEAFYTIFYCYYRNQVHQSNWWLGRYRRRLRY